MQYRPFGKTEIKVSVLGFGAMRLPILDGDSSRIDEPQATAMIRRAVDAGVNYVDTAYPYHGGTSEAVVGRALRDGYRDRVSLATKMPVWKVEKREDFDALFAEQLARLGTGRIDCYLLHALNQKAWPKVRDLGVIEWLERHREQGDIGHIGFSFHDGPEAFTEIADAYGWEFCQIQYNYMDTGIQAGRAGLLHAAERGMGVIVMEPLKGGKLARPPEKIRAIFDSAPVSRSPAAWALRWVWDHPQVSLALSGMGSMAQVEENLELADESSAGAMTDAEKGIVEKVRLSYEAEKAIDCTSCGYCLPCPAGVAIPRNIALYNDGSRYGNFGEAAFVSRNWMQPGERAEACTACGQCEEKCPQRLTVRDWMQKIAEKLGKS